MDIIQNCEICGSAMDRTQRDVVSCLDTITFYYCPVCKSRSVVATTQYSEVSFMVKSHEESNK